MKSTAEYCRMTTDEALTDLRCDLSRGLSEEQARSVLDSVGENSLREKRSESLLVRFFKQFNDFMVIILLSAAAISFVMSFLQDESDIVDGIIILCIVTVNAILGLVQEYKAEKSLEALKKMTAQHINVIRGGRNYSIETRLLVPGDIILLQAGDYVPADARLLECHSLKCDEASLTGESVPVEKDEHNISEKTSLGDMRNMVFSGTFVTYGRGKALVCATGMDTEVGKIADMLQNNETPQTPMQKKLERTGKTLGIGAMIICVVIFFMGIFRDLPPFDMFMTSVSLAVAAIPEGLPAIVTIMLALGVRRMALENAIVRKLPAVETLGNASVICSDKTGTLTQNRMKVIQCSSQDGVLSADSTLYKQILRYGILCGNAFFSEDGIATGDPTETALLSAAYEAGMGKLEAEREMPRLDEVPFDSTKKRMYTLHGNTVEGEGAGNILIVKGAPDILIKMCGYIREGNNVNGMSEVVPMSLSTRSRLISQNADMASKALRVIAVAYKVVKESKINERTADGDLIFLGMAGMMDPPRKEAAQAVRTCKRAGIKPVMVTGDHIITAKAVARNIGLFVDGDKAITGEELSKIPDSELAKHISEYSVVARVSPETKVRIVKAFQKSGAIVAMTGDGVNDAPALKAADIGCAMGITGTEVAKAAADMVLTDDNFATIVKAVREGRAIHDNIKRAVHFLLSSNIGEILTIFSAIFMGWASPLFAIHLLWVNLVTDSLPAIALGLEAPASDVMERKPVKQSNSLFNTNLWMQIVTQGVMIGLLALIAFGFGSAFFDETVGRTMCFATLSISQLFHAFNMRSEGSLFKIDILGNMYLVGALCVGILLQVAVISVGTVGTLFKVVPLSIEQWAVVFMLSILPILIVELCKLASGSLTVGSVTSVTGDK